MGKSALLEFAVLQAADMLVLRTAGLQGESDIAYAGLFGLLRPLLAELEQLSEPQARALAGALGIAAVDSQDRFLVSAGVLSLLAAAAEERPIVCLVDDVHWLDRPSAEALVFAARRLGADAVAMVFAARADELGQFDTAAFPELELQGLGDAAAAQMLAARVGIVDARVRTRLLAEAAGNPLALLELPQALSAEQLAGREQLPEHMPLTPRLRELFQRRISQLPQPTQAMLLLCASDSTGDLAVVLDAAHRLGLDVAAFEAAQSAGLVTTNGEQFALRHPLVRSAVIDAAALGSRQRVHAALADALVGEQHIDRRVWHQALAALTGDEEVAIALEASAKRAQERAGFASASTAFQRAAELTRDDCRLAPRLAAAADAAWNAGQPERASALVERALRFATNDLRSQLLYLQGVVASGEGRSREAVEALLAAAGISADPSLTLQILIDVIELALQSGSPERLGVELGQQAERLSPQNTKDAFNRSCVMWYGRHCARQFERAQSDYDVAMRFVSELEDDAQANFWATGLASMMVGCGAGLSFANRAVEVTRRQGRLVLLPPMLAALSGELLSSSLFDRAYAAAGEGYRLALDMGQRPDYHLVALSRIEAIWGQEEAARAHAHEALDWGGDSSTTAAGAAGALALLELGCGQPDVAAELLQRADPQERLNAIWTQSVPDLIEAIVRAGLPAEQSAAPLARLRRASARSRARQSLVARCEALLGERSPGEGFAESLTLSDGLPPFERARTELLYGEWLRRERRRKEARTHLRAAIDEFRRLGAKPWKERAEIELRASGETARKREPMTLVQLTPQELQIAQLAAAGHSNPEIAAQLYLSPRTIEYHLRKVFSKLGISGRTELLRQGPAGLDGPS